MIGLDVGCGHRSTVPAGMRNGYEWLFLDRYDFSGQFPPGRFIRHDLRDPLPFSDSSVDLIWCHHVLEHLPPRHPTVDIDFVVWVVNEFHRVLKVGCAAHLVVPWKEHTNAWRSPTHYRFFDENTFRWFASHERIWAELEASGVKCRWRCDRSEVVDGCHVYGILVKPW